MRTFSKQNQNITILVLAGGQGKRMMGLDKGLQPFQGKPLIAHILEEIALYTTDIFISANRNQTVYESFGYPVYPDEQLDFSGPLSGFLAGLRHCASPYMATVPCDTPFFKYEIIQQLLNALETHKADIAVAVTENAHERRIQSVFTVMKTTLKKSLEDYLKTGNHKISPWLRSHKTVSVFFNDESMFININTLEELDAEAIKRQY